MSKTDRDQRAEAYEVTGWKRCLIWLGGVLIRLWCSSLRFDLNESSRAHLSKQEPAVFLLWHNRLFTVAEVYRRFIAFPGRRMHGLISGSKDGAWLAGIFQQLQIEPIRGSSSWRATQALREVVKVLQSGGDVGITPDGPRGPCYSFQPGASLAAKLARCPVVMLGIAPRRYLRLKSWDGFMLPLPFSKVVVRTERFETYAAIEEASGEDIPGYLRRRLLALSGEALSGAPSP
ncbi:MAG: lysophospholipid acyltransferase family protein [Verrucomicrobiota bacterium]